MTPTLTRATTVDPVMALQGLAARTSGFEWALLCSDRAFYNSVDTVLDKKNIDAITRLKKLMDKIIAAEMS